MKIDIKPSFKLIKGFQNFLCHQLKRGLYKVFLEETERQNQNGHDSKYDFIREYSRFNLGEYPIFYFPRKIGLIAQSKDEVKHPKFHFENQMLYHIKNLDFFEFELFGHLFSIPLNKNYDLLMDKYLNESFNLKRNFFYPPIQLKYLTEIDLLLKILNSE